LKDKKNKAEKGSLSLPSSLPIPQVSSIVTILLQGILIYCYVSNNSYAT